MKHEAKAHGQYEHEMDKVHNNKHGRAEHGMGCSEFKGQADSIAYGQAGEVGCGSDNSKIHSQMKNYHWEGETNH